MAQGDVLRYSITMRRDEAIARLKAAEPELRRFGVGNLYLFGSVARDEAGLQSDIDVFVEPGGESFYDLVNYMGSYERLQAIFPGKEIGYATRDGLAASLRSEIEREAIRVF